MRCHLLAFAVGAGMLMSAPACADPIVYTISALVHGTLDSTPYYENVVFTGVGDTIAVADVDGNLFASLSSLTMAEGSNAYHLTTPSWFAVNATYGIAGFIFADTSAQYAFTGYSEALIDYDIRTTFGQSPVATFWPFASFDTDRGSFALDDAEDMVFTAAAIVSAPEPAAWSMLVIGFGIIGSVMRGSRVPRMRAGR